MDVNTIQFSPRPALRRGFTFTEVMFAVIILGVGFVMIAAILPVAIQQSKANVDEATAGAVSQSAINAISNSLSADAAHTLFPPTGVVGSVGQVFYFGDLRNAAVPPVTVPPTPPGTAIAPNYLIPDEQIKLLMGNMINGSDPRFGWVGFYQRDLLAAGVNASFARVTVVVMQSRLQPTYSLNTDFPPVYNSPTPTVPPQRISSVTPPIHRFVGTFQPGLTYVYLTERVDQPDLLTFETSAGGSPVIEPRAGEGAFVIIAKDPTAAGIRPGVAPTLSGALNGKVYRLGQARPDITVGTYELQPGYDMTCDVNNPTTGYNENIPFVAHTAANRVVKTSGAPALAYIVGRGLPNGTLAEDPSTNLPEGTVQDVSVYQTIVPLSE